MNCQSCVGFKIFLNSRFSLLLICLKLALILVSMLGGVFSNPIMKPQYKYRHFDDSGNFKSDHAFKKTNLLFIIYDDLRPDLSVYGKAHLKTPNFDRLAAKSVTFDRAYAQVAVCNPSRNSLLTGLRPDFRSNFAFESGYKPYLIWPTQLARSGYKTSGFGKIRHHEGPDKEVWNHKRYDGTPDWYTYQFNEWSRMNSSVMPDKKLNLEEYPDHVFAQKTIHTMSEQYNEKAHYFMIGLGFKMPHLCMHLPHQHFDMYRQLADVTKIWKNTSTSYRTFPSTAPMMGYRCCAEDNYRYMNREGMEVSVEFEHNINTIGKTITERMYNELMWGYAGMVSFTDEQLGKVLDTIDRLMLWDNITIVLTSDHGMHNGEKGLWEKWTVFEESTWVPLMIYHPDSPYKGQRFQKPVELLDIYPTIIDLLVPDYNKKNVYVYKQARHTRKFVPLQGKSLAPVLLGSNYNPAKRPISSFTPSCLKNINDCENDLNGFAISQTWRCAKHDKFRIDPRVVATTLKYNEIWLDCDMKNKSLSESEVSVMGYSFRTIDYRYTAWINWDRVGMVPIWDDVIFDEELYDHRLDDLNNRYENELINFARNLSFMDTLISLRHQLLKYLYLNVTYNTKEVTEAVERSNKQADKSAVKETYKWSADGSNSGSDINLNAVVYGGKMFQGNKAMLGKEKFIDFSRDI